MSRTYELGCDECKVTLWIGQATISGENPYIYKSPEHLQSLQMFLFEHRTHQLRFLDEHEAQKANGFDGYHSLDFPEADDD